MSSVLTTKDERIDEMFDVKNEVHAFGMQVVPDPYPAFARCREKAPVHKGTLTELIGYRPEDSGHMYMPGATFYTAFSFNAVNDMFMDNDTFSSRFYVETHATKLLGDTILNMGGDRHRRFRDVLQPHFQPAVAMNWWNEKFIKGPVEELVSSFEKDGKADLSLQFFARLPMFVVTAGFGLSSEEGLEFRSNMQKFSIPTLPEAEKAAAMATALGVLSRVIAARRKDPRDDIISRLVQAKMKEADGSERPWSDQEVLDHCRLIVFAGGGTTWRQVGITLFALLEDPKQMAKLKANRELMPNAILESARWNATDPVFPRMCEKDTTIHGVDVPKNAAIHLCLGAANRDPSRWKNPDEFDIERPLQRSLAFGTGVHSCLGQHVARQELNLALNAVLDRLPNIRWDPSKPKPTISGGLIGRGASALTVVWG